MQSWFLEFLVALPAILWAISVHEFAHGMVAYRLGDPTPKLQGRLTLNPLAHIDVVGFIALILVHFGWAKPVVVNPANFRILGPRKGNLAVALAGPLVNIASAYVCVIALKYLPLDLLPQALSEPVYYILRYGIFINIAFGVFNLLPIPPLDGSKVLEYFLPYDLYYAYKRIEPYGFLILLFLVISPLLGWILVPLVDALERLMFLLS